VLAEQEHQQRHQARQRRLLHEAQLPVPKTLADYDWNAIPDLERPQIEQLAHDTGWLDRAENLLLFGPSGVGKTHLAAGICRSLIALDRSARFYSATTLVQELQRAKADYALAKALSRLDRYALLVIDDIGYVRKDEAETSVSSDIRFWSSGDTKTGPADGVLTGPFWGPLDLCFIGGCRVGVVVGGGNLCRLTGGLPQASSSGGVGRRPALSDEEEPPACGRIRPLRRFWRSR
jgi:hypothetical protein